MVAAILVALLAVAAVRQISAQEGSEDIIFACFN